MKKNYTHISFILDRTGSMQGIRDETINGFNAFLEEQKEQPGEATLTLVQFDLQDPYEIVHHFAPIKEVPELTRETFVPRASTPLLDAIGHGINDLESTLMKMNEEDRPSSVIMVILTDGKENSSKEFSKEDLEKMIGEHIELDDWRFIFLGADFEGINDARSIGIPNDTTYGFQKKPKSVASGFHFMTQLVTKTREDDN